MTVVIGTAGHIDHGKSTLLRAITGMDPDRLPDERRRGLTIDVGYAHGLLDDGPEVDFVDVPGHERLVGNMLVGAGEMDAALLVAAADDGPRPQTWEHLGLLDALGISHGVAVVTKSDLVDRDRVASVRRDVDRLLSVTTLAGVEVVAVSAQSGDGMDALRRALARLRGRVVAGQATETGRPGAWLAIDRAFSIRGHGAVVTGSSRGAPISRGDRLWLMTGTDQTVVRASRPTPVRVRAVHVHDAPVGRAPARGRVALNLAGVPLEALARGGLLVSPHEGGATDATVSDRLLVALRRPALLPGRPGRETWPPPDALEARLHIGTDQVAARVRRSGRDEVTLPDGRVVAVLRLERPVATAMGEPFLLRRPPPAGLLAGGVVLDVTPPHGRARHRQTAAALARLAASLEQRSGDELGAALLDLHGARPTGSGMRLAPDVRARTVEVMLAAVSHHHRDRPQLRAMPLATLRAAGTNELQRLLGVRGEEASAAIDSVLDELVGAGDLLRDDAGVRLPGHASTAPDPGLALAQERLVAALDTPSPPSLGEAAAAAGVSADGIRELERAGRIVLVGPDLSWSEGAFAGLVERALDLAEDGPLTPAALRDASGTSRKYVLALLEELDRRGILLRTAAGHVRGPRAAAQARERPGASDADR